MATRYELPADDERTTLRTNVIRALMAVPMHFTSSISMEGLRATDLFALNTLLGGAIEEQTVKTLNATRSIWDPEQKYANYEFRRYSESFPDVRLQKADSAELPKIGIELKGWYLLSKEREPSFRFKASADAMTEWDLIAVFPWSLSEVLSGAPELGDPFIEQAKYAADMRTEYWESRSDKAKKVEHPDTHPYPDAGSVYSDIVHDDGGGNFGRIARVKGLMDEWVEKTLETPLAGINAKYWIDFFKCFDEKNDRTKIEKKIEVIAQKNKKDDAWTDDVWNTLVKLVDLLKP